MNIFKHTPCVKCRTTALRHFSRADKYLCTLCRKQMKFSPHTQDYYSGLVNQELSTRYWKTLSNTKINYGKSYSEINVQQTI